MTQQLSRSSTKDWLLRPVDWVLEWEPAAREEQEGEGEGEEEGVSLSPRLRLTVP